MFNTVITAIQGFLSKSFWFVSFLPVTAVALLHLILVVATFPDLVKASELVKLASDVVYLPLIVVGLIFVSYIVTPLVPALRSFLDGLGLPRPIREALRREHVREVRAQRDPIDQAMGLVAAYEGLLGRIGDLWTARGQGVQLGTANNEASVFEAERAVALLAREIAEKGPPPIAIAADAFEKTRLALAANSANAQAPPADAAVADRVNVVQQMLLSQLGYAKQDAEYAYQALSRDPLDLLLTDVQATRIGDMRFFAENYSYKLYDVEFDFLWPRIQVQLKSGDPLADKLASVQDQLNFAVLSLVLTVTIPLVWVPLLAWRGESILVFALVWLLGTGALFVLHQMVVLSEVAFATVVTTIVDFYRLEVLAKLRQPSPATLFAERQIWAAIREAAQSNGQYDLIYRPPPAT